MADVRLIDASTLKEKRTCLWDSALGRCACVLIKDIDDAPTINPDDLRPQGRWVHDHYENCTEQFEIVKCSNCGYTAYAMAFFVKSGNYCPNCGAKMDGKENE